MSGLAAPLAGSAFYRTYMSRHHCRMLLRRYGMLSYNVGSIQTPSHFLGTACSEDRVIASAVACTPTFPCQQSLEPFGGTHASLNTPWSVPDVGACIRTIVVEWKRIQAYQVSHANFKAERSLASYCTPTYSTTCSMKLFIYKEMLYECRGVTETATDWEAISHSSTTEYNACRTDRQL